MSNKSRSTHPINFNYPRHLIHDLVYEINDPYIPKFYESETIGFSFSVPGGREIPHTLQTIYTELASTNNEINENNTLKDNM